MVVYVKKLCGLAFIASSHLESLLDIVSFQRFLYGGKVDTSWRNRRKAICQLPVGGSSSIAPPYSKVLQCKLRPLGDENASFDDVS